MTPKPVRLRSTSELAEISDQVTSELETILRELLPACQVEHIGATSMPDGVTKGDVDVNIRVSPDDFLVPLRDLMRSDAALRHQYDRRKREAASLGPSGYWAAKDAFLTEVRAQMARSRPSQ